jgi:hypothetical protein
MMQELDDKFLTIKGIGGIIGCPQTKMIGCWNILTNEEYFFKVLKDIKHNYLQPWLEATFQGTYDRPANFPEIQVTA